MAKKELQKGFTCDCGEIHRFSPYVYAHWREDLVFTCPNCKRKYEIFAGLATERH